MTDDKTPLLEPLEDDIAELMKQEQWRTGPDDAAANRVYASVVGTLGLPIDGSQGPDGSDGSGGADNPGIPSEGNGAGAGGEGAASSGGVGHALTGKGMTGFLVSAMVTMVAAGVGGLAVYHSMDTRGESKDRAPQPAPDDAPLQAEPPIGDVPRPAPSSGLDGEAIPEATSGQDSLKEDQKTPATGVNRKVDRRAKAPPGDATERLAQERRIIDAARSALAEGDVGGALGALQQHRRRFEKGMFVEERDALTIMALAKRGRNEQADAQADRFNQRYPNSLFRDAIRAALRSTEP